MDQYPTEEEEFELMYQDEMDLVDDMHEINVIPVAKEPQPGPSKIPDPYEFEDDDMPLVKEPQPGPSKSPRTYVLDDDMPSTQKTQPGPSKSPHTYGLDSPALSQISNVTSHGPVNRCLFGTPGPSKRVSSTPFPKQKQTEPSRSALHDLQNIGRKRKLDDLFGDIRDIEDDDLVFFDSEAKKLKSEEERDMEMIEAILNARKQHRENRNPLKRDAVERLNALHEFKKQNLSRLVPKWPFLPLVSSTGDRIYIRFHNEDYEKRELELIKVFSRGYNRLLGDKKEQIWNEAREITVKRMTAASHNAAEQEVQEIINAPPTFGDILWVEKYKPKKYIDLLSDETTNRSLLRWLKMWDKVVFGKEIKAQKNVNPSKLNTFNKKSGKFESTGGWTKRSRTNLNTDYDEHDRPVQKVALLCGPPGLGKTTLAHTIARHAGYNVRELNASDDRSPEAFRLALENGTQMTSVLNNDRRPNCIVLDEIDGAPQQSIDFLLKFVNGEIATKAKKGTKVHKEIVKRPIICICNDLYVPALRQLRQTAFIVNFPPIETSRLAERLLDISRAERMNTDLGTLLALSDKSGNDVRSCISMMQFFNAMKKKLELKDVLNASLGQKDRHRGLFDIWTSIFQVQRPRKQITSLDKNSKEKDDQIVTMTDMSESTRVSNILDVVHSGGDYERLMQGVFENYLSQKMPDPDLRGIVTATNWFCFSDIIQTNINHSQNYTVYPYLQYGFVVWHLLFASLAWPRITFPTKGFEFNQKATLQKMIFQAFKKGVTSGMVGIGDGHTILLETIPLLKKVLAPNLRSVSIQLLTPKERYDLTHTVDIMVDLGLTFTQLKSADGTYQYQMEPDLDSLCHFTGYQSLALTYFGRQLIAREVELERMKRSAPRVASTPKPINKPSAGKENKTKSKSPAKVLPNHLQTLQPKILRNANMKETISKDFFGRVTTKQTALTVQEGGTDIIVKSPIWYRYKEGFNNAVRKDVTMADLL